MPAKPFSVTKAWLVFFGFWLFLLTGVLNAWFGGPGLKQLLEVRSLLDDHRQQATEIEFEIARLKAIQPQLENNAAAQEREIRKVLGYLGKDEVVFEF